MLGLESCEAVSSSRSACSDVSMGDEKIYRFESYLEVEGVSTYPETLAGNPFHLTIRGSESRHGEFSLTLDDFHVKNEDGSRKYRKARGLEIPVYDVPKGIGILERQRGTKSWNGYVWVKPQIITDMLTLLPHITPLFLALHEHKVERSRWITGLTLQTTDPAEE